ncbi:hypothetical protein PHYPSEUDO_009471 [Phytophthora pseudosyringae]|uniref:PH domain-containing protein n=1 Tax=Phytophthora pseudosyringae TaxID=221518 RepID=A0A8T1VF93_9STRA|nr:hypothetical protein PHYPSEUDO_009471 [Phytophthora pseudosyringae]
MALLRLVAGHLPLASPFATPGLLFIIARSAASPIARHGDRRATWDRVSSRNERLAHFPIARPIAHLRSVVSHRPPPAAIFEPDKSSATACSETLAAAPTHFESPPPARNSPPSTEDTAPMTRQGYLIVHDKRSHPAVRYLSLEDGFLRQYASADCAKCLNEVRLSGCKIAVKAQKRADGVPNSFYLETRKVFVKDRSYTLGNVERVEFSACSGEDRQEWGKALFSWQRYYWRDPADQASPEKNSVASETRLQLEQIIAKHFVQKPSSGHSLSFAAAKQPISFLRRNAHSLRRSLSMTSTVANTAKPESDAEPTDCVKDKVALAKVECPEAAKNNNVCQAAAVTPHYLPAHLGRGNNQEAH